MKRMLRKLATSLNCGLLCRYVGVTMNSFDVNNYALLFIMQIVLVS